jgi:hypothetical protein
MVKSRGETEVVCLFSSSDGCVGSMCVDCDSFDSDDAALGRFFLGG